MSNTNSEMENLNGVRELLNRLKALIEDIERRLT